jgi:outer membrane lipoprotein-sorting protein
MASGPDAVTSVLITRTRRFRVDLVNRRLVLVLLAAAAAGPNAVAQGSRPATGEPARASVSPEQGLTFDKLADRVLSKWTQWNTYSCRYRRRVQETDGSIRENSEGTLEVARADDTLRFRLEMREKRIEQAQGEPMLVTRLQVTIDDGKQIVTFVEELGDAFVRKSRKNAFAFVHLDMLFKQLRPEDFRLQVEESEVNGRPAYLLRIEPLQADNRRNLVRHDYYFDKQRGVVLLRQAFDQNGLERLRIELDRYEFDQPIDPQRFVFQPPRQQQLMQRRRIVNPP